jgi:flagellum-specific ATP synthase
MSDIISAEHLKAVFKFRRLYTILKENEVLIRIGAYQKGSDPELDEAISKKAQMEQFLSQKSTSINEFNDTVDALLKITSP